MSEQNDGERKERDARSTLRDDAAKRAGRDAGDTRPSHATESAAETRRGDIEQRRQDEVPVDGPRAHRDEPAHGIGASSRETALAQGRGLAERAGRPDARPLRIAQVAPVASSIPPARSSSIELMTSLLTEGLVRRGHQVTLFATGASRTSATLHATFARGYAEDVSMWPWDAYELFNVAAAMERAGQFDIVHCQSTYAPLGLAFSRLVRTPVVQTVHHAPSATEVALWRNYPEAPFIAISAAQRQALAGLNVVGTVLHGIDTGAFRVSASPGEDLLFLGRFTEGKGVLAAIDVARRVGRRLILAAAENDYYRDVVAPHVDNDRVVYVGEVDHDRKVALLGDARALLYPVLAGEPFGLVIAEAMACGTPVAALNRGAVPELVEHGVTGGVFDSVEALAAGLDAVLALDRTRVRARTVERFGLDRMVDGYVRVYRRVLEGSAAA